VDVHGTSQISQGWRINCLEKVHMHTAQAKYVPTSYTTACTMLYPDINHNQYSKTKVMHFLLNLLSIKGLYMFQALLTHLHEALNKGHLVYCVRYVSWLHHSDITRMLYTKCHLCIAS
jgi:hypothetical protein